MVELTKILLNRLNLLLSIIEKKIFICCHEFAILNFQFSKSQKTDLNSETLKTISFIFHSWYKDLVPEELILFLDSTTIRLKPLGKRLNQTESKRHNILQFLGKGSWIMKKYWFYQDDPYLPIKQFIYFFSFLSQFCAVKI